jgi:PAS domain S-box-containing protein
MGGIEIDYCQIFDKVNQGIFILDIETAKILNANKRATEITGYSVMELINEQPLDISSLNLCFTKRDADETIQLDAANGNQAFECELKRKDGSTHWIEVSYTIANIGGKERGISFFHVIDDRKRAEISLQKSEANLRSIFNNTEISFVLLDKSFSILSFNETAKKRLERIYGVSFKQGVNWVSLISEENKRESNNRLNNVIAGNAVDFETYYEFVDGSVEWYRIWMNPVNDSTNNVIGVCISAANITDEKFSAMEREKLTIDLLRRNKDLQQFAYIVSHNLRAPVANIMGLTHILNNIELEKEEEKQINNEINIIVKKIDEVIQDLNSILQLNNRINEKKVPVSFSELIANIQTAFENLIQKENVQFICDFSETDKLLTLKSYLYCVFLNLISNSIKYRQPSHTPIIEIKSAIVGNKIELHFKDNGLGIDLEKRGNEIFGLYKRFHSHIEGKGMGLFMIKKHVELLGGKVTIKSEVNKGTEFRIEFENELK